MKTASQALLVAAFALSLLTVSPLTSAAGADDYWTNHWNWYDNTYRPYYYRNYNAAPAYSNYGHGYYNGNGNYAAPGYNYGPAYSNAYGNYGNSPYRSYYGTGGIGYGRIYGGGSAVNVGPTSFGWR
jgi:hypothetical protein